jgi:hypothetical protein
LSFDFRPPDIHADTPAFEIRQSPIARHGWLPLIFRAELLPQKRRFIFAID